MHLPISLLGSLISYVHGFVIRRKRSITPFNLESSVDPHAILTETFSDTEIAHLITQGEFLQVFDATMARKKRLICITFGENHEIPHEDIKYLVFQT